MNSLTHQKYKNKNTEKKNSWHDWLVKYILEIVKNTVGNFKGKIVSLLKTNTAENYSKRTRAKNVYKDQKIIKAMKDKIISDTRNFIEQEEEEEDSYKPEKVDKFYSDSFIIYESKGDKNKTLSIEEYLYKIRPNLKYIINDLKRKHHTWKIQLTIAINVTSSKDNDEELVMRSRSDNIELIIND